MLGVLKLQRRCRASWARRWPAQIGGHRCAYCRPCPPSAAAPAVSPTWTVILLVPSPLALAGSRSWATSAWRTTPMPLPAAEAAGAAPLWTQTGGVRWRGRARRGARSCSLAALLKEGSRQSPADNGTIGRHGDHGPLWLALAHAYYGLPLTFMAHAGCRALRGWRAGARRTPRYRWVVRRQVPAGAHLPTP